MSKRLYVGNLAWATKDEGLKEFFSKAGNVISAEVIINKFNGRSKGFGFVEMENEEQAQNAMTTLDRQQLDGRMIFVNVAKPPKENLRGEETISSVAPSSEDFVTPAKDVEV